MMKDGNGERMDVLYKIEIIKGKKKRKEKESSSHLTICVFFVLFIFLFLFAAIDFYKFF